MTIQPGKQTNNKEYFQLSFATFFNDFSLKKIALIISISKKKTRTQRSEYNYKTVEMVSSLECQQNETK